MNPKPRHGFRLVSLAIPSAQVRLGRIVSRYLKTWPLALNTRDLKSPCRFRVLVLGVSVPVGTRKLETLGLTGTQRLLAMDALEPCTLLNPKPKGLNLHPKR